jgi:hypothetical protein
MRALPIFILGVFLLGGVAVAQTPVQPAQPAAQAPRPQSPPAPPAMPVNVRIDVVIIDEGGPENRREAVTMTASDREGASVRSDNNPNTLRPGSPLSGDILFNADAMPIVSGLPAGKVRVRLVLEYWPVFVIEGRDAVRGTRTRASSNLILDDGKPMVVSDTTDPASNRRVRVEVTATILK